MPTEKIDSEIEAIHKVLTALEPLNENVRGNVLDYVLKRLKIHLPITTGGGVLPSPAQLSPRIESPSSQYKHIAELKTDKGPETAVEMAALVAYFLMEFASVNERKDTVNASDMKTYFKIAEFKKKTDFRYLLPNAKTAGYFDSVDTGQYKLNAVGYNLAAHSLPKKKSKGS